MTVLAPDVTLLTDGGGKTRAALRPITGAGTLITGTGGAIAALTLTVSGGRVTAIQLVANPDKLTAIAAGRTPADVTVRPMRPLSRSR